MDNKLMESYLDKIAELVIDEGKIVTYKSLSRSLKIHVNTAKQLLYAYLTKEKSKNSFPLSATYLVSGKVKDGTFNVSIVNEVDLKSTHPKFMEITSEHVYSIQKGNNLKDVRVLFGLHEDSSESPLVIKCSKSILKSEEEVKKKKTDSSEEKDKKVIEADLAPEKETLNLVKPSKSHENQGAAKSPKQTSPKGNSAKVQGNVKKSTGNIAKLFAAQKNTEKSVKVDKSTAENKDRESEPASVCLDKEVEVEETESKIIREKSEIGKTAKGSSKRKTSTNKRKRIQMLSDSDYSDCSSEDVSPAKESSPPALTNIEDERKEAKEMPQNKRKKRKVIDKTVMNEDGYLETKKEIVFETDSENEIETEINSEAKDQKPRAAPVIGKGKGAQTSNVSKKQSSLLTFFKKS